MKKAITLLMLTVVLFTLQAQQQDRNEGIRYLTHPDGHSPCATVENHERRLRENPNMESRATFEAWLAVKMREAALSGQLSTRQVLKIPVVVHLVHLGEPVGSGYNLPYSRITSQIDALNEDFRRMMGTNGFNTDPNGADTEIEFCLAYVDTSGAAMPEPGLNRVNRNDKGFREPFSNPGFKSNYIDAVVKPALIWDPYRYMNIFVVPTIQPDFSGGSELLGYAMLPGSSLPDLIGRPTANDRDDGFVVRTTAFGRGAGASIDPCGRTATHEIGHWLGLYHTWGSSNQNTDCFDDDFCMDTPQSDQPTFGCAQRNYCGTQQQFRNYMDYTDGCCKNVFTICQRDRMRTVLQNSPRRKELLTSTVCLVPTQAPLAGFTVADTFTCDGVIRFRDASQNIPTTWLWTFGDGSTSTRRNPNHLYAASGTYRVTLIVSNSLGANVFTRQLRVQIGQPISVNAGPDIRACTGDVVQLGGGGSGSGLSVRWSPAQGLSNPNILNPILLENPQSSTYFFSATDSQGCVKLDTIVISISPLPIVSAGNDITLGPPPANSTQLNASSSANILRWRWTPNYGFVSSDTVPNPFVAPDRTVTYTVTGTDSLGCNGKSSVKVTIPNTNPLSITKDFESQIGVLNRPYPNPAQRMVTFSAKLQQAGALRLSLVDATGRAVETLFEGQVQAGDFAESWTRQPRHSAGLYLVVWEMQGQRATQKLRLQ